MLAFLFFIIGCLFAIWLLIQLLIIMGFAITGAFQLFLKFLLFGSTGFLLGISLLVFVFSIGDWLPPYIFYCAMYGGPLVGTWLAIYSPAVITDPKRSLKRKSAIQIANTLSSALSCFCIGFLVGIDLYPGHAPIGALIGLVSAITAGLFAYLSIDLLIKESLRSTSADLDHAASD